MFASVSLKAASTTYRSTSDTINPEILPANGLENVNTVFSHFTAQTASSRNPLRRCFFRDGKTSLLRENFRPQSARAHRSSRGENLSKNLSRALTISVNGFPRERNGPFPRNDILYPRVTGSLVDFRFSPLERDFFRGSAGGRYT